MNRLPKELHANNDTIEQFQEYLPDYTQEVDPIIAQYKIPANYDDEDDEYVDETN